MHYFVTNNNACIRDANTILTKTTFKYLCINKQNNISMNQFTITTLISANACVIGR